MELTFTNKNEIHYIEQLVNDDIKQLQIKLENRKRVWSTIQFAKERGDF